MRHARQIRVRPVPALAVALSLAALLLAGCSGGQVPAAAAVTVTQEVTRTVTPTTDTTTTTTDMESPTSGAEITGPTSAPPTVRPGTLGLADFFEPSSDWTESRFDVADKGQVQGVSARIDSCSTSNAEVLELRLSNKFTRLSFQVAQANSSKTSDGTLTVEVSGNGRQLDVRKIAFNTVQDFGVPVQGVNATQIKFHLETLNGNCPSGRVIAVLYDAKVS
jgi:hypothetical protein